MSMKTSFLLFWQQLLKNHPLALPLELIQQHKDVFGESLQCFIIITQLRKDEDTHAYKGKADNNNKKKIKKKNK